jgi:hypothetical protein
VPHASSQPPVAAQRYEPTKIHSVGQRNSHGPIRERLHAAGVLKSAEGRGLAKTYRAFRAYGAPAAGKKPPFLLTTELPQ